MKKNLTVLAALAICTAAPAFAGQALTQHHEATSTRVVTMNTRQVEVPLTSDEVTWRQQEQTKLEREVKRVDLNGDRLVSFDEYANGEQILHKDNQDIKTSFRSIDTNGDGKLNSQELMDARWAAVQRNMAPTEVTSTTTTTTREVTPIAPAAGAAHTTTTRTVTYK